MKTLKIMSIIGIVWFGLWMLVTFGTFENYSADNQDTAAGCAMFMFIYGIAYSIVGLSVKTDSAQNEEQMKMLRKHVKEIQEKLNNAKI